MYGCCVLLHFVLTRCMRLLGNSPYAPFIYNSTANAGHAGPHPRSVIRLRAAPKRRLKQWHGAYKARARESRRLSRARIFRGRHRFFSPFSPAPTLNAVTLPRDRSRCSPPDVWYGVTLVSLLAWITPY